MPAVSPNLIHALRKYTAGFGLDLNSLPEKSGGWQAASLDPNQRFSPRQFNRLWTEIIQQAGDPDFGLHFVENTRTQPGGEILSAILFNCPTVGSALEKLSRYHCLTTDLVQIQIFEQSEFIHYAWNSKPEYVFIDRQISEAVLCRLFFTIHDLSDGKVRISEIRFRRPRPDNIETHQRIFGCTIKFNQEKDEIILRQAESERPIPLANPLVLERLDDIAEEMLDTLYPPDTWPEQVTQRIMQLLRQGEKPDIDTIARDLMVSTRQLQGKLKEAGVTYRSLLDQVRKEMAARYLKEVSYYETAFLLGFADQSAFNHAFKRWTGMTPTEYQQTMGDR
ncbi:MAG: AraC family transcriptional regulator [Anaerolineales bacterium]|nr:AraC family transcriptional regulator [Anaerolineales bacterium]